MEYMKIGHSDVTASVITLGAWSIGGGNWWRNTEDELSIRTIERALELGINTIDTAPIYGVGHSEEIVGKAIAGKRDQYVISTKATFDWDTGVGRYCYDVDGHKMYIDHSYAGIKKDCENSLRRLGTDYIYIYYTHNPARDTEKYPVSETVRALMDLKNLIYLLQYLPISYLLCRCYERTNSIWGSIFLHMLVNGVSMWLLYAMM